MHFTCLSCGLSFDESQSQKDHMRTEWHRYNLKRRVTQLPPIDEDTFKRKTDSLDSGLSSAKEAPKSNKKSSGKKGQAKSRGRVSDSVSDGRSKSQTEALETDDATGDEAIERIIAQKREQAIDLKPTTCLFCPQKCSSNFETVSENVEHMAKMHGLFIPEKKYIIDLEGLVSYLGEKLGWGNVCLSCSYQGRSLESVREHMRSKRHMRIPYESDEEKLEISDFYDFTPSYSSARHEGEVVVQGAEGDEDQWEDVSENDSNNDLSDDDDGDAILDMGDELLLPSGLAIGHRTARKQRKPRLDIVLSEGQGTVVAAESRQLSLGAHHTITKPQQDAWKAEKKMAELNDRRSAKYANNQPHFRDQLLQ